jgi:heme exporter protein D
MKPAGRYAQRSSGKKIKKRRQALKKEIKEKRRAPPPSRCRPAGPSAVVLGLPLLIHSPILIHYIILKEVKKDRERRTARRPSPAEFSPNSGRTVMARR